MSGKPKHVDSAEDLRQVLAEARGVAKDLRAAIAEARQLGDQLETDARDRLQRQLDAASDEMERGGHVLIDHLESEGQKLLSHVCELIGAGTASELTDAIIAGAAKSVADQLRLDFDEREHLALVPVPPEERPSTRMVDRPYMPGKAGKVYVTTDPALVPPDCDLIIDGR